jgi:hypothetical protein
LDRSENCNQRKSNGKLVWSAKKKNSHLFFIESAEKVVDNIKDQRDSWQVQGDVELALKFEL